MGIPMQRFLSCPGLVTPGGQPSRSCIAFKNLIQIAMAAGDWGSGVFT